MRFDDFSIEDLFTRCMDCDDMTLEMGQEEFAALRRKIAELRVTANTPAIPAGWKLVPIEPTEAMMLHKSGCQHHAWDDKDCAMRQIRRLLWSYMLAAAPQPPVSASGWIPVAERLPDSDEFVQVWPRPDFGVELQVGQYCRLNKKGPGWYAQVYEQNYGIEWHPINVTHWMPMPADPKPGHD